jgi:hypothetical protein
VQHVKESLNSLLKSGDEGFQYIYYCLKQLPKEDQELAKKLLSFPKGAP